MKPAAIQIEDSSEWDRATLEQNLISASSWKNRFRTRTSPQQDVLHAELRRLAAENDEIPGTAVQQTAHTHETTRILCSSSSASYEHATQHNKQAARDQTQAAIESPGLSINLRWSRSCIESNKLLNNTCNNITCRFSMGIAEALQALHQRDEGTAQQLRARDGLTEQHFYFSWFQDAGDVASHWQERITSAGASMTTRRGC